MTQYKIPDFIQGYYEISNNAGQTKLEQLARQYEEERATFMQTTFVAKEQFQRDWNKLTGKRKELTPDEALKPIKDKYKFMAEDIALQYSYGQQDDEETLEQGQDAAQAKHISQSEQEQDEEQPEQSLTEKFTQGKEDITVHNEHRHEQVDLNDDEEAADLEHQTKFKAMLDKFKNPPQKPRQRP